MSEALLLSRIDHWLRNRHLVFHDESMNRSIGYSGTLEAIAALLEDLGEYEDYDRRKSGRMGEARDV